MEIEPESLSPPVICSAAKSKAVPRHVPAKLSRTNSEETLNFGECDFPDFVGQGLSGSTFTDVSRPDESHQSQLMMEDSQACEHMSQDVSMKIVNPCQVCGAHEALCLTPTDQGSLIMTPTDSDDMEPTILPSGEPQDLPPAPEDKKGDGETSEQPKDVPPAPEDKKAASETEQPKDLPPAPEDKKAAGETEPPKDLPPAPEDKKAAGETEPPKDLPPAPEDKKAAGETEPPKDLPPAPEDKKAASETEPPKDLPPAPEDKKAASETEQPKGDRKKRSASEKKRVHRKACERWHAKWLKKGVPRKPEDAEGAAPSSSRSKKRTPAKTPAKARAKAAAKCSKPKDGTKKRKSSTTKSDSPKSNKGGRKQAELAKFDKRDMRSVKADFVRSFVQKYEGEAVGSERNRMANQAWMASDLRAQLMAGKSGQQLA